MPAAVADKKGEYLERTIYSTFSGGKQLAGFQVKRDFIGAGRNLWDKRDYVQYFYRQTNWRYTDSGGNWNDVSCSRILSRGTVGVGDGWILAALGTLLSTETMFRCSVWVCFLRQDGQVFFLQCLERAEKQRYRWFRFCWQDI